TPRVLGIDDWAMRRGQTYGTMIVDLEKRRRVDLLPDRKAEPVASWLAARPGVEVVSRDRSAVYADGIRKGAPEAIQIADRWHLHLNAGDALERVIAGQRKTLETVARQLNQRLSETSEPSRDKPVEAPCRVPSARSLSAVSIV